MSDVAEVKEALEQYDDTAPRVAIYRAPMIVDIVDAVRRWVRVAPLLEQLSNDMHAASKRPCPTCEPLSEALGVPFGCLRLVAAVGVEKDGENE